MWHVHSLPTCFISCIVYTYSSRRSFVLHLCACVQVPSSDYALVLPPLPPLPPHPLFPFSHHQHFSASTSCTLHAPSDTRLLFSPTLLQFRTPRASCNKFPIYRYIQRFSALFQTVVKTHCHHVFPELFSYSLDGFKHF